MYIYINIYTCIYKYIYTYIYKYKYIYESMASFGRSRQSSVGRLCVDTSGLPCAVLEEISSINPSAKNIVLSECDEKIAPALQEQL